MSWFVSRQGRLLSVMFGRRGKESTCICIYQVAGRSSTRAGGGTKLRSSQLTSQEGMQVGYMSSLQHSRGRLIRQKAYKGSYDTVVEDLGRMLLLLVLLEIHSIYRHVCGRNRHPRLLHLLSALLLLLPQHRSAQCRLHPDMGSCKSCRQLLTLGRRGR